MTGFLDEWASEATAIETRKRRLQVLRYLERTPGYEGSATLLRYDCWRVGVPSSDDQIMGALEWLAEHEMIELRRQECPVARLTAHGRDIALGVAHHSGVLRPEP